ncbi:MAG TPA: TolC family protein, partial [Turneriella sp.]|nr:TolC family protein [Turneriella sp.]
KFFWQNSARKTLYSKKVKFLYKMTMVYFLKRLYAVLFLLLYSSFAWGSEAQSVVNELTLDAAESMFLSANYQLLAGKFQIDAAQAQVLQARLWTNPNITFAQSVYTPASRQFFDFRNTGETQVQLEQLFLLAGKRGYQIKAAQLNAANAEQNFYDLLRTLRIELQSNFYGIHFMRENIAFYDEGIAGLKNTVLMLETAYKKRLVLLSEVMRIRTLLFSLQNERTELVATLIAREHNLKTLLGMPIENTQAIIPKVQSEMQQSFSNRLIARDEALKRAKDNRPDLKMAINAVFLEENNLALQHALKYPDITVGANWDRAGPFTENYFGLQVTAPLPTLNRNQGNIATAEKNLNVVKELAIKTQRDIERDVMIAYERAVEKDKLYQEFKDKFNTEYQNLVGLMFKNYQKRYITVIEFADFYEAYRNTITTMIKLEEERVASFAVLAAAVNAPVLRSEP